MTRQLTGTAQPCSRWGLLNTSGFYEQPCSFFIVLERAAACRARWDCGIWYPGVTKSHGKSASVLQPAGAQLRKGVTGKLLDGTTAGVAAAPGMRRSLTGTGGIYSKFWRVKALTVHARNQEGSIPGSTHPPWMGQATPEPQCSQGGLVTTTLTPLAHEKPWLEKKKNLSAKLHFILVFFFLLGNLLWWIVT